MASALITLVSGLFRRAGPDLRTNLLVDQLRDGRAWDWARSPSSSPPITSAGAGWATALRRIPEAMVRPATLVGAAGDSARCSFFRPALYPWSSIPRRNSQHLHGGLQGNFWLSRPFFLVRGRGLPRPVVRSSPVGPEWPTRAARTPTATPNRIRSGNGSGSRRSSSVVVGVTLLRRPPSTGSCRSSRMWFSTIFGLYNFDGDVRRGPRPR